MDDPLLISVYSFSYLKSGIPDDMHGNGGGFVFDCRGLPNPGRLPEFAEITGQEKEAIDYLEQFPEVNEFVEHAYEMAKATAKYFRSRLFSHMMVSFGCTGGQHRSVYCAEKVAEKFKSAGYKVEVKHIDKPDFSA